MFRRAVDLFTPDEHAVLADWFRTEPPETLKISNRRRLPTGWAWQGSLHYLLDDAVVASIVLEQVERQLPGWSAFSDDGDVRRWAALRDYLRSRIGRLQYCAAPSPHRQLGRQRAGF